MGISYGYNIIMYSVTNMLSYYTINTKNYSKGN